jgi:uncharacterized membrane protein YeaQ/YmgE (transglycosylase-associated protein family)
MRPRNWSRFGLPNAGVAIEINPIRQVNRHRRTLGHTPVKRGIILIDDASSASRTSYKERHMDPTALVIWLLIGAAAGWLAGLIMGEGFGLVGDIIVGIVGAFIAGALFPRLGLNLGGGIIGAIIAAAIGACLLLFILRLMRRA